MAQSIATLLVVVVALVGGTALPCSAEERNVSPDGAVAGSVANSGWYTAVQVVDAATGRGVPHVCLSTVNNARWLGVESDGYRYPKDFFGFRGTTVQTSKFVYNNSLPPSQQQGINVIHIHRINLAERMYRLTGEGIYRDSALLGIPTPLQHPDIDSQVVGQDSVYSVQYNDEIFWLWGDTQQYNYPLGNFHTTCATSPLPQAEEEAAALPAALPADVGVNLQYFDGSNGFVKGMVEIPGPGVVWCGPLISIPTTNGDALYTVYNRNVDFETKEWGLAKFSPSTQAFQKVLAYPLTHPLQSSVVGAHASLVHDAKSNTSYMVFASPMPWVRCAPTHEALIDLGSYEAYTPLKPGATGVDVTADQLVFAANGSLVYEWKTGAVPLHQNAQQTLESNGVIDYGDTRLQLRDSRNESCYRPNLHGGSTHWNEFLQQFVMVFGEGFGASFLGETWVAASPTLEGPWVNAVKVVTHNVSGLSFYNPMQHYPLSSNTPSSPYIYLSGTLSNSFTNKQPIPRYDYNNVMYRLDLSTVPFKPVPHQTKCLSPPPPPGSWQTWQVVAVILAVLFVVLLVVVVAVRCVRRRRLRRERQGLQLDGDHFSRLQ